MKQPPQLTTLIEREGAMYVSLCPELDMACQGDTVEEALELIFAVAHPSEVERRLAAHPLEGE
jgi:hypothetical protein